VFDNLVLRAIPIQKLSRFKDRKELNISLISDSLRSLNLEVLAVTKNQIFSHNRYKEKVKIL
jgi:hypothetical protein